MPWYTPERLCACNCGCILGCSTSGGAESTKAYNQLIVSLTSLPTSLTYGGYQSRGTVFGAPPYGNFFMSMTTWVDFVADYVLNVDNITNCYFAPLIGTISSPAMRCTVYQDGGVCGLSSPFTSPLATNLTPTLEYVLTYDSETAQILLRLIASVEVPAGAFGSALGVSHELYLRQSEFANGLNPYTEPDMWARCNGGGMSLFSQYYPYPESTILDPDDPAFTYCPDYPPPLAVTGTYELAV